MTTQDEAIATTGLMHPILGNARKNWGWLLGFGILSVVLGTAGLGMTFALTLVSVTFFGILLAVGGGFQLVDAFQCKGWKGTLVHVLIALLYLGTGLVMAINPLPAAVALTLVLGVMVIVVGVLRIAVAIQHRASRGWGWALAGGVISILLGALVLSGWPVSGLWVIGLVIAVELIVNGWTYIFVGLAARRAGIEAQKGGETAASPPVDSGSAS
jgi:uncharacterized membrane protein HdeD (DUF308 family)